MLSACSAPLCKGSILKLADGAFSSPSLPAHPDQTAQQSRAAASNASKNQEL